MEYGNKGAVRKIALLALVLLVLLFCSVLLGRYAIAAGDLFRLLFGGSALRESAQGKKAALVLYNIRLPRVLLACLVGAGLSTSGAVYQTAFRNHMASPDILGASAGAAFGASLAIVLGMSARMIVVFAFVSSIGSVLLAFWLSEHAKGKKVLNLILAGMMASSLCTAGTSYMKIIAEPGTQLQEITFWLMGSLSGASRGQLGFAALVLLLSYTPLFLLRWRMNALSMEDSEAHILGVNAGRLRLFSLALATFLVAFCVSVSGIISWVGLIVPHFARKWVGNNMRYLLPASTLLGAIFLLLVDDISRNLLKVEIPIGILTALIGVPFFMYLFVKKEEVY